MACDWVNRNGRVPAVCSGAQPLQGGRPGRGTVTDGHGCGIGLQPNAQGLAQCVVGPAQRKLRGLARGRVAEQHRLYHQITHVEHQLGRGRRGPAELPGGVAGQGSGGEVYVQIKGQVPDADFGGAGVAVRIGGGEERGSH